MENQIDKQKQAAKPKKSILIKPFSKMHKGALLYYILSFVVLFFKIFILKQDNLTGSTYRVGYAEFAFGIGWIYYAANLIGLLTVISPMLKFIQGIGTKIISIVNLTISGMLLFSTIPDAINPNRSIISIIGKGELGPGFYLILGLHLLAVLLFWFSFIRKVSKKNANRIAKKELLKQTQQMEVGETLEQ